MKRLLKLARIGRRVDLVMAILMELLTVNTAVDLMRAVSTLAVATSKVKFAMRIAVVLLLTVAMVTLAVSLAGGPAAIVLSGRILAIVTLTTMVWLWTVWTLFDGLALTVVILLRPIHTVLAMRTLVVSG